MVQSSNLALDGGDKGGHLGTSFYIRLYVTL